MASRALSNARRGGSSTRVTRGSREKKECRTFHVWFLFSAACHKNRKKEKNRLLSHTELLDFTRFQNYRQKREENSSVQENTVTWVSSLQNRWIRGTEREALEYRTSHSSPLIRLLQSTSIRLPFKLFLGVPKETKITAWMASKEVKTTAAKSNNSALMETIIQLLYMIAKC